MRRGVLAAAIGLFIFITVVPVAGGQPAGRATVEFVVTPRLVELAAGQNATIHLQVTASVQCEAQPVPLIPPPPAPEPITIIFTKGRSLHAGDPGYVWRFEPEEITLDWQEDPQGSGRFVVDALAEYVLTSETSFANATHGNATFGVSGYSSPQQCAQNGYDCCDFEPKSLAITVRGNQSATANATNPIHPAESGPADGFALGIVMVAAALFMARRARSR